MITLGYYCIDYFWVLSYRLLSGTTTARFINDDERYQPPPSHNIMQIKDSDEREKRVDVYSQNEAKKNGLKNI